MYRNVAITVALLGVIGVPAALASTTSTGASSTGSSNSVSSTIGSAVSSTTGTGHSGGASAAHGSYRGSYSSEGSLGQGFAAHRFVGAADGERSFPGLGPVARAGLRSDSAKGAVLPTADHGHHHLRAPEQVPVQPFVARSCVGLADNDYPNYPNCLLTFKSADRR